MDLLYGVRISAQFFRFITIHSFNRQTDRGISRGYYRLYRCSAVTNCP